jgi:hypothetical protein
MPNENAYRWLISEDDFPKLTEREEEMPQLVIYDKGYCFHYSYGLCKTFYPVSW